MKDNQKFFMLMLAQFQGCVRRLSGAWNELSAEDADAINDLPSPFKQSLDDLAYNELPKYIREIKNAFAPKVTFEDWQLTRRQYTLDEAMKVQDYSDYFIDYKSNPNASPTKFAYIYRLGYLTEIDLKNNPAGCKRFIVDVYNTSKDFDTIAEAEAFLWNEYVNNEINATS
jgi:hypothetical protein